MSAVALPRVSGGHDEHGHLEEFRTDPIGLMQRVRDECGDVGTFQLAGKQVVLLSGSHANEFFFRAGDDDLDQAKAYPFMTPIFGEGVVFDASPERRKEMLHNAALRGEQMKGHAATIEDQVRRMIADWGEAGEIDLLDFFAELTIYTSSACLIGKKFRDQLDGRFAKLYHELERGTDPLAYVDPYLPIESFRRRDEARNGLVALVADIMNGRIANPPTDKSDRDMLDVLIAVKAETGTPRFSADEITGMFISMMFAGHHTSSGTASWTLIELMRHRDAYAAVIDELDELYGDGRSVSFHALRQIPQLENVLKETLRLHPPLIILMRVAKGEFEVQGHRIHEGDLVAASPAISNRIPEDFPDPHDFVPARYEQPRQEDLLNRWTWIPFGAGRHRCVGAAFAIMQIKAIFSVLLREYEFEMAQPPESYRNDHSKMVVQLAHACATAGEREFNDGLSSRSRPGSVPRTRDVRAGGTRVFPGAQARPGRNPRPRAARGSPRRDQACRVGLSHPGTVHPRNGRVTVAGYPRDELEDVVHRWLQANRTAERRGDWTLLADFYTDDATYGWNVGPNEDVMCVGIDEIRDIALGQEMDGLQGWRYPYQRVVIDEKQGEVVGFWKQVATDANGAEQEVYGIGGSWFRYAGGGKWNWQRDFFDFGHVSALYLELIKAGKLSPGMQKRIERAVSGNKVPGYYPLGKTPVPLW